MHTHVTLEEGRKRIEESNDFPMGVRAFAKLIDCDHTLPRKAAATLGIAAKGRILLYTKETALKLLEIIVEKRAKRIAVV